MSNAIAEPRSCRRVAIQYALSEQGQPLALPPDDEPAHCIFDHGNRSPIYRYGAGSNSKRLMITSTSLPSVGGLPRNSQKLKRGFSSTLWGMPSVNLKPA